MEKTNNEAPINNLLQLLKRFPDEQSCRDFLEQSRWHGKVTCVHCGSSERIYRIQEGKLYKCGKCRKPFSAKIGTIFEDSALPLQKWFHAIFVVSAHKKGISSCQLARDISVTQKTAWHMLHRIRLAMTTNSYAKPLDGIVEADETFIGGRKHGQGSGPVGKAPVFGMVKRGGELRVERIADVKAKTMKPVIRRNISPDAILMTDNYTGYKGLEKEFKDHQIISHSTGEYVRGICHTNTIEGFWSLLKRGIVGIYHHVSPKHLSRYCEEFEYRYNSRKAKDNERFALLLTTCEGRLTYKQLKANA